MITQLLNSRTEINLEDIINKNMLSDYVFKLNVSIEQLNSFANVEDWSVIALVASVPSFYMSMEQIVDETYKLLPTSLYGSIDWKYLISFLIKEGIWVIKYGS